VYFPVLLMWFACCEGKQLLPTVVCKLGVTKFVNGVKHSGYVWPIIWHSRNQCRHLFIHFIVLAYAECDDSFPSSGASSIPLCYMPFPSTPFHRLVFHPPLNSSCHLFLGLLLGLVVTKFIYNTFWGILFSSTLCTCPNQCNLFSLIVSVIVGFLTTA